MALPFFYSEDIVAGSMDHVLNEESSRHIVQVLRMRSGEKINVTNGNGYIFLTEITDADKKGVSLKILGSDRTYGPGKKITIAISPVKNTARFEWFLEKATEIGVTEIIPVICKRTEKHNYRADRMRNIVISAMLQSQQAWLPALASPEKYEQLLVRSSSQQKFIAHCAEGQKASLASLAAEDVLMLIGPEGDFTNEEITMALKAGFKPVSLGSTRLRTETAGIVAAAVLSNL